MKRAYGILILALLSFSQGCTFAQLRNSTVNQGSTISDIQYQMVLRNLASFAENPWAVPWHLSITGGTTQVADAGTARIAPLWDFTRIRGNELFQLAPSLSGSRTVVQQWSTNPIVHTDALRVLQLAYRRAFGAGDMPDRRLLDDIANDIKKQIISTDDLRTESVLFYQSQFAKLAKSYETMRRGTSSTIGEQSVVPDNAGPDPLDDRKSPLAREVAREVNDVVDDLRDIPTGWFGIGGKKDVPKHAAYVAHDGAVYVWVNPEHREDLSKFTMLILDIATAVQEPEALTLQGVGLSFSPGFTAPQ
jgi:hypothetical protein